MHTDTGFIEKEVFVPRRNIGRPLALEALCLKHHVELEMTPVVAIIKIHTRSENLLEFSGAVERYGLLVKMDASLREAYLRDLRTSDHLEEA